MASAWTVVPAGAAEHRTFNVPLGNQVYSFNVDDNLLSLFSLIMDDGGSPPAGGDGPGERLNGGGLPTVSTYIPNLNGAPTARHAITDLNARIRAYNSSRGSLGPITQASMSRIESAEDDARDQIADVQSEIYRVNGLRSSNNPEVVRDAINDLLASIHSARGSIGNATGAIETAR